MDLIEKILNFLNEEGFESTANHIQTELNTVKKPSDSETCLNKALEHHFPSESLPSNLHIMQNFIRKLEKIPIKRPKVPQFFKKASVSLNIPKSNTSLSVKSSSDYLQNPPQPISPNHSLPYTHNQVLHSTLSLFEATESQQDQYENNDDLGFLLFECTPSEIPKILPKLLDLNSSISPKKTPSTLTPSTLSRQESWNIDKSSQGLLPDYLAFPESSDKYYPRELDNTTFDCFSVKVIYDREKTGFEDSKDFPVNLNDLIAGRYRVIQFLGSGNFSQVFHCLDEVTQHKVCLKIVENCKETLDQALDEVKILRLLKANCDVDLKNILNYIDCLYHKEHLLIVTELLRDNLSVFLHYEQGRHSRAYFSMGRIQKLAFQVLTALVLVHSLNIIHADVKPENIVIKSYSQCLFKVIDFGSASFVHDKLGSYAQRRNYRAPEVILGFHYDGKIDVWSLGCILFEVFTGRVLFDCNTVQEFLAKVLGLCGQLPSDYYKFGRHSKKYFTKENLIYLEFTDSFHLNYTNPQPTKKTKFFIPKKSSLRNRMNCEDLVFVDFIRNLLIPDKSKRPSANQALQHPFLTESRYKDGLFNP